MHQVFDKILSLNQYQYYLYHKTSASLCVIVSCQQQLPIATSPFYLYQSGPSLIYHNTVSQIHFLCHLMRHSTISKILNFTITKIKIVCVHAKIVLYNSHTSKARGTYMEFITQRLSGQAPKQSEDTTKSLRIISFIVSWVI